MKNEIERENDTNNSNGIRIAIKFNFLSLFLLLFFPIESAVNVLSFLYEIAQTTTMMMLSENFDIWYKVCKLVCSIKSHHPLRILLKIWLLFNKWLTPILNVFHTLHSAFWERHNHFPSPPHILGKLSI